MQDALATLLGLQGVRGVLLFRAGGEPLFSRFSVSLNGGTPADWFALALALGAAREAEMLFERGRVYLFRSPHAVLLVLTGVVAPSAVIRMSSAVLLAEIDPERAETGARGRRKPNRPPVPGRHPPAGLGKGGS